MSKTLVIALSLSAMLACPLVAQKGRRVEQDAAYEATRQGAVKSLRSIENSIVPGMKAKGADYIGAEYVGAEQRYRLKFMRRSSVIWVDVDGRNGAIIGKAGE